MSPYYIHSYAAIPLPMKSQDLERLNRFRPHGFIHSDTIYHLTLSGDLPVANLGFIFSFLELLSRKVKGQKERKVSVKYNKEQGPFA